MEYRTLNLVGVRSTLWTAEAWLRFVERTAVWLLSVSRRDNCKGQLQGCSCSEGAVLY